MPGKPGAVIEGDGPPQASVDGLEPGLELLDGTLRGPAELRCCGSLEGEICNDNGNDIPIIVRRRFLHQPVNGRVTNIARVVNSFAN